MLTQHFIKLNKKEGTDIALASTNGWSSISVMANKDILTVGK
jgi:hypothetical protein